jgi:putative ABC transport system substrate-binding protein
VKRREFIVLLGGATAWPLAAGAQQPDRLRRIGVLMGLAETDQFTQGYVRELRDRLQQLGWTDSRNIQFAYRYAAGDPGVARAFAKELVEMQPDLIVGHTTPVVAALSQTTRTVPVVFVSIPDPVLNGFVASMARPGGNMTGFTNYEFTMGAKWLEILKEIAPKTARGFSLAQPGHRIVLRRISALSPNRRAIIFCPGHARSCPRRGRNRNDDQSTRT